MNDTKIVVKHVIFCMETTFFFFKCKKACVVRNSQQPRGLALVVDAGGGG